MEEEKKEGEAEDKGQAPVGCGGKNDMYTWTQTLEELQVYIPVETGLKGKECKITMTPDSLAVSIRGQPLFSGKLHKKINVRYPSILLSRVKTVSGLWRPTPTRRCCC